MSARFATSAMPFAPQAAPLDPSAAPRAALLAAPRATSSAFRTRRAASRRGPAALLALTVLGLVACGGAAPAPSVPVEAPVAPEAPVAEPAPVADPAPRPLLSIDWTRVSLHTDADALTLWQQIGPTGADWMLRLGELPDDRELLRRLALALLRAGNYACRPAAPCSAASFEAPFEVAPTATLDDPCLRRELALWSFNVLDEDDAAALERELLAIAALPPPEEALLEEAFELVPAGNDELLLRMMEVAVAAGQGAVADEALHWLSPASLVRAATRLHSNGAVRALDPVEQRATVVAAIVDARLAPATSVAALEELLALDDPPRKDLRAALKLAVKDPRCEVAAAAVYALALGGDRRHLPRPGTTSLPAAVRALCVMASYLQEEPGLSPELVRFVSRRGLQVYDHADLTADIAAPVGEVILPAELVTLPFLEELSDALGHCTIGPPGGGASAGGGGGGSTAISAAGLPSAAPVAICRVASVRFELAFDPDRTLRRLDRFAEPSACAGD